MKRSELKKSIKAEIVEILAEASQEDIKAQSDLNAELEKTKTHASDLGDALSESNKEISNLEVEASRYSTNDSRYKNLMEKINTIKGSIIKEDDEMDDDEMDKKASKGAKRGDSVSKIANKLGETTKQMKAVVRKYKDAEEPEKSKLLNRLKELTKIKKELEGLL